MKSVVVTGANRGIGLELTKQFATNHNVYALCRSSNKTLAGLTNVHVIENVDVTNQKSIDSAVAKCPDSIDLLINNAGCLKRVSLDSFNEQDMNNQWDINAMGPLRVTCAFLNHIRPLSKVALITSRMGSIEDNDSGSHYGYRMSKAALNMAGKSMAIDLKSRQISVGIIHPGWVQTDMTGNTGHVTVEQSVTHIIERINQLNLENSGTFWHANGEILPW